MRFSSTGTTTASVLSLLVVTPAVARPQASGDESSESRPPGLARAPVSPGWLPPVLSMAVPGMGQLVQRKEHGAVYLIAEAFLLERFLSLRSAARSNADQYRDIALRVARAPFDPLVRDTVFEYFEQMSAFIESGLFDTDPGPGLSPPTDETTYNGSIWALARETYFSNGGNPLDTTSTEYRAALAFYRRRAVGPNFRWSWRAAGLEQDLFRQTIREGDETFRRAQQHLGLLLANHLLSAVDAYILRRLARHPETSSVRHRLWIGRGQGRARLQLLISIGF